jgi:RNA recognition motif-containing protein
LHLVAKISDPTRKQDRNGPIYEGREIHVSNVDWKANEQDLQELFERFGTVELVRIPRKVDGGSKGFGYVVFSSKEEANAALALHEQEFRSRPLQVRLSAPQGAKRTAATVVSRIGKSQSPAPEINGASPSGDLEEPTGERRDRTLGLMNVPDTVNDARIRALVEPYGKLVKIVLRPDHQGAIVEFADVNHAGKAALELEGQEISAGRKLHVGTVSEMLKQSAEKRNQEPGPAPKVKSKPGSAFLAPTAPIKRPPQPGGRSGKRGGLGIKRGIPPTHTTTATTPTNASGEGDKNRKSNDDFRAMIQRSQGQS